MSLGPFGSGGLPGGIERLHELEAKAKTHEIERRGQRPYHKPPKDERPGLLRRLWRRISPYR